MKLLVSLHDITPFHLKRLLKAETLCQEIGLRKLTYLFIPNYHGCSSSEEHPEFVAWCRKDRPFQVKWHLHGYHHLEDPPDKQGQDRFWSNQLKRRFLTAGEAEFLDLDTEAQRRRLESGRAVFRHCLRCEPNGFVAPAWLFNAALSALLKELGFQFTEDHHRIFSLATHRSLRSPVITWATRTTLHKYGSLVICPMLSCLWKTEPVLRVAIHPFDLDHPQTMASIRKVLTRLMEVREQSFYEELDFAAAG
jgi:predicted deacetylase